MTLRSEPDQINFELIREDDGSLGWMFDVWSYDSDTRPLFSGAGSKLEPLVLALLEWVRENDIDSRST